VGGGLGRLNFFVGPKLVRMSYGINEISQRNEQLSVNIQLLPRPTVIGFILLVLFFFFRLLKRTIVLGAVPASIIPLHCSLFDVTLTLNVWHLFWSYQIKFLVDCEALFIEMNNV